MNPILNQPAHQCQTIYAGYVTWLQPVHVYVGVYADNEEDARDIILRKKEALYRYIEVDDCAPPADERSPSLVLSPVGMGELPNRWGLSSPLIPYKGNDYFDHALSAILWCPLPRIRSTHN